MTTADLVGQRFGRWTVIAFSHLYKGRFKMYVCHCDCGTARKVFGDSLTRGKSKSCSCLARAKVIENIETNIVGQHFGSWDVIAFSSMRENKYPMVLAKCICGTTK